MADRRTLRVEQDGRDFYVMEMPLGARREVSFQAILKGGLVTVGPGTEEETMISVPRLGLYGDSTENGQAWRAWFIAYCHAHGFACEWPPLPKEEYRTIIHTGPMMPAASSRHGYRLPPETQITVTGVHGVPETTTWGEFCAANKDDPSELPDVESGLIDHGAAVMGGGSGAAFLIRLVHGETE